MRVKAAASDELRKSIAESDDDATRSSSGGGSSAAGSHRQIDLSLLRKPILTAVTGFLQAHKAYDAGTEEIRKLLANECDVLYECRVCRNIFRSLTNFISHKRVYCRKLFNVAQHFHFENDGFLDQDISIILQAEQDSQRKAKKIHADVMNKDLSSIVERLRRKQHKLGAERNLTEFYDKVNHKLTQDDLNRQQHLLQLDRSPETGAAVFQTVRHGVGADNMLAQVDELNSLVNGGNNTVLGPDGKVLPDIARPQPQKLPVINDPSNQYFKPIQLENGTNGAESNPEPTVYTCLECNVQFDTEKTLNLHSEIKHTPSTYVYSCPSCSRTFLQPSSVIRHLSNDHKKSMRRIKSMRDSILKRRTRVDEIVVKGPSREVARLLQSSQLNGGTAPAAAESTCNGFTDARDEADATRAWMENLEHFDQGPMCSYCGKTFDRKAVLTTHMQTCVQKIRQTENGAVSVPPMSGRRSRARSETVVKIKQEPADSPASEDSNSCDVPLATLQARYSQSICESEQNGGVVTVKPEELDAAECRDVTGSRRKRKKPTIMLRNASDDLCWEADDGESAAAAPAPSVVVVEEYLPELAIKEEPVEQVDKIRISKRRKSTSVRKKKEEEIDQKEAEDVVAAEGVIECKCTKMFVDVDKYKRHVRVFHNRQRRFWCAICDFKGYRKVDTMNHLIQTHGCQGGAEDIGALINLQTTGTQETVPVDQVQEPLVSAVIEAVSRNCDTVETDISFMETTAETVVLDAALEANRTPELSVIVPAQEPSAPKKRGRPRGSTRESMCVTPDDTKQKLTIGKSSEESLSPTSRRPIRNRIKPVDKDFVYDLTHLLHKEEDLDDFPLKELVCDKPAQIDIPSAKIKTEPSRAVSGSAEKRDNHKRDTLRSHATKPKNSIPKELVSGAAYQMAKRQVDRGLAAFHRSVNIPKERSTSATAKAASPHKHKQRQMTAIQDWRVVKKERKAGSIAKPQSENQLQRKYSKSVTALTEDTLSGMIRKKRRAIPRRNSVVPLPQRVSASVEILQKLNASRSAAGLDVVNVGEFTVQSKYPSVLEFRRFIEANLKDHRAAMSQVNLNGTTVEKGVREEAAAEAPSRRHTPDDAADAPRKRITLMQRLQENRNKRLLEQNSTVTSKALPQVN